MDVVQTIQTLRDIIKTSLLSDSVKLSLNRSWIQSSTVGKIKAYMWVLLASFPVENLLLSMH